MTEQGLTPEFLERLVAVRGKRSKIITSHILEHGFITTEEIETTYGYKHLPRAARDVREQGIPLETFYVESSEGRRIAAYRFDDPSTVRSGKLGGRVAFSKGFKQRLIETYAKRCSICLAEYEERYLQIDHCIPFEVSGDPENLEESTQEYMLLCGSCNRAKSWSCEHCENWRVHKSPDVCLECYWASPEAYEHVAMRDVRRLDLVWSEQEDVETYDALRQRAEFSGDTMPDYVKSVLKRALEQ